MTADLDVNLGVNLDLDLDSDFAPLMDGVEKHTATALASIAMLTAEVSAKIPSPA